MLNGAAKIDVISNRRGRSARRAKRRAWACAAAAAAAVFAGASACRAQEVTSYWSGVTGSWTDPTQWSTDPNYPNNGTPSGTTYDAVINAPGTALYGVTLNSNLTVDSVTVDSPNAQLAQTGETLTTASLNVAAGEYVLRDGVLEDTTLTFGPTATAQILEGTVLDSALSMPTAAIVNGYLIGVTLTSDITTGDTLDVKDLDAAGHTITLGNPLGTRITQLDVVPDANGSGTLSNVNLNMTMDPKFPGSGGYVFSYGTDLTMAQTVTAEGWGGIGAVPGELLSADPILFSQGTITANTSGMTLTIAPTNFVNSGTVQATNGGVLSIMPGGTTTWTNNGILAVDSISTINVNQNITFANGSAFDAVLGSGGVSGIITIAGNLKFQSNVSLNLSMLPGAVFSGPYEIASYTGTLTGSFAEVTTGFTVSYSQPGEILVTADTLLTSPLPEPGRGLIYSGAYLLLAKRRRRA